MINIIDKNSMKQQIENLLKEIGFYDDIKKLSPEEREKVNSFKESFINQNFEMVDSLNQAIVISNSKGSEKKENEENLSNSSPDKENI